MGEGGGYQPALCSSPFFLPCIFSPRLSVPRELLFSKKTGEVVKFAEIYFFFLGEEKWACRNCKDGVIRKTKKT